MCRSALRLILRGGIAAVVGAVLLSLASPALLAQTPDDPVYYTEMRLVGPLTTYTDASASSAVKATLPGGSVVDMLTSSRVVDASGMLWAKVRQPNGEDLGWAKLTELNIAAGNEPYYGFSTYGTSAYNPNTGTYYNPNTGTYTPINPNTGTYFNPATGTYTPVSPFTPYYP